LREIEQELAENPILKEIQDDYMDEVKEDSDSDGIELEIAEERP